MPVQFCFGRFVFIYFVLYGLSASFHLFFVGFFLGWGGRGQENLFHNRIYYLYISIGKRINAISYKIWRELVLFLIASNSLLIVDSLNCFN